MASQLSLSEVSMSDAAWIFLACWRENGQFCAMAFATESLAYAWIDKHKNREIAWVSEMPVHTFVS
jgi:hypothetical protein